MIPPVVDESSPPGEVLLHRLLAAAPGTDDWVVLHSVRIADHPHQQRGEADFVVVVPGEGVAVLEVKSHQSVSRDDDGRWRLGSARATWKSPFAQADDAKFAIEKYLSRRMGTYDVHIESAVWFTHTRARSELVGQFEWADWQVLDSGDVADGPAAAADCVVRLIRRGRQHRSERDARAPRGAGFAPPKARQLADLLRPVVDVHVDAGDVRRQRDDELARLMDGQMELLDCMRGNRRLLVTGPAGCGKTFMALRLAREESAAGHRGLLLCFNHALEQHLQREASDIGGLRVATLPGLMVELSGLEAQPHADKDFWERRVAAAAWESLVDAGAPQFDYLLVDEAQDVCRSAWLDVLDQLVAGGLRNGRCVFFGDFQDQVIYAEHPGEALVAAAGEMPSFDLPINCRNTPAIAQEARRLGGPDAVEVRCRRRADGEQPVHVIYETEEQQQQLLVESVRRLRDEGFGLREIAILSRYRDSAAARCVDPWLAPKLVDVRRGGDVTPSSVQFSTIHSFKGLESPAVILTDITESGRGPYYDLMNVGITRARDRLVVIATREGLAQLEAG